VVKLDFLVVVVILLIKGGYGMSLKIGDMFAGVGGIALGFKQAGFDVAWANEYDGKACITYRANFNHPLFEGDVKNLDPSKLPKVDIITSGFPCQAFSVAGLRRGFKDPRGNLFFETAKFINVIKPKAFLLENVKNLKSHDGGKTLETIRKVLTEYLGYSFSSFILSAYNHGNIPQSRERLYMIGFKDDYKNLFNNSMLDKFNVPNHINLNTTVYDLIDKFKHDEKYYFNKTHKYISELEAVIDKKWELGQWRRVYVRKNKRMLCPTLTANMGMGGHNVPILLDDYGYRRLTPRECFRFQGFNDNFVLPNIADSHLYKQAGNSVTVPVIRRLAEEFFRILS
jgi:DNA (cytosine-5)-methyltransferase 1